MKKQFLLVSTLTGLMALSMSGAFAQNIAIVNGKAVPKALADALTMQVTRAGREVTPKIEKQIRDEVIAREIFMQEADKRGLSTTPEFKAQMELARQSILIGELRANFQKNNPVTDADLKAEYDKFVAANGGKEYKARHILVEKESEAKAIIASLKKGGKFEAIAKKSSKDPGSGANGGDLDWASPSNYVPEFAEAVIGLKKGETSQVPVKTQFGYHVIRVDDIRTAQLPAFEEVKPQIAKQMEQQKLNAFQQGLRDSAKIE
jgi:peptidyl-prolyl cis-trans isomerase C